MVNRLRGGIPLPNYRRLTRVSDPTLRGLVPALSLPADTANQSLSRVAALLNRAGSGPQNPILAGLSFTYTFELDERDRLLGLHIYRDRRELGPDLVSQCLAQGENIYSLGFMVGDGVSVAGSPLTGAVRNFIQILSKAGKDERSFWVKSYDKDVVTINGQNVLNDALDPVTLVVPIIDDTQDWLNAKIDFMVGWGDEFQVMHNRNVVDSANGNLKAYGGALFVSLFQTGEDEGQGTELNPVTQELIHSRHTLQLQNTEGLKHVTARFRSRQDSAYFVDVDFVINVVAAASGVCAAPYNSPCVDLYLKKDADLPADVPNAPSSDESTTGAGVEGDPVSQDLLIITARGATVGGAPKLRLSFWGWVEAAAALAGARLTQIGGYKNYYPLVDDSSTPTPPSPYGAGKRYTVALSKSQLASDNVAIILVEVLDGDHVSDAYPVAGPAARGVLFFPPGGDGGGPTCAY